MAKSYQGSV